MGKNHRLYIYGKNTFNLKHLHFCIIPTIISSREIKKSGIFVVKTSKYIDVL